MPVRKMKVKGQGHEGFPEGILGDFWDKLELEEREQVGRRVLAMTRVRFWPSMLDAWAPLTAQWCGIYRRSKAHLRPILAQMLRVEKKERRRKR